MNIAVFGDLHGSILAAFHASACWQQETGEQIDLMLQVGDLGVFPEYKRLDRSTRRHSEQHPEVLGFLKDFVSFDRAVANILEQTKCNLVFVRGNHEDHIWLDHLEQQSSTACFPVDVYRRLHCLKSGIPYRFQQGEETITLLGVGRIGRPAASHKLKPHYLQPYEQWRIDHLEAIPIDVLLTHDAAQDQIYAGAGSEAISFLLENATPCYHYFGHYGGPCQRWQRNQGLTRCYKLAEVLSRNPSSGQMLRDGSMGILRWKHRGEHHFEISCQVTHD